MVIIHCLALKYTPLSVYEDTTNNIEDNNLVIFHCLATKHTPLSVYEDTANNIEDNDKYLELVIIQEFSLMAYFKINTYCCLYGEKG